MTRKQQVLKTQIHELNFRGITFADDNKQLKYLLAECKKEGMSVGYRKGSNGIEPKIGYIVCHMGGDKA